MAKSKIAVVIGSTRGSRFSPTPAKWIAELAGARGDIEVEVVDLLDYPMAFLGEERTTEAQNETAERWKKKMREFDGYIFTVAEYNHGPTAVLKNAIDMGEWIQKPFGFVGYGGVGGARAVEHLRLIAVEMQAASVKTGVHILFPEYLAVVKGEAQLGDYPHLAEAATSMLDQLVWWAKALKAAREA
ncbi:NADPH-dependent oxidoreductase [Phyllobacterium salinisoli]|uniref:NADPH-dependent oxidoreductase n=1 Tax=Phyllobacterium salinisoli TaxID=1899321 RepID=A0A368K5Y7_9HYPH|nr:NAD(P)H-dependent oxidoreductase [Phyllobacterium salinisoli]RCS24614.1 NADPH-dependent oxidoreductase [Phyllobacterium salinisoli]